MKGKLLLGVIALAAIGVVGYFYVQGPNTGADEENVRLSFSKLVSAISAKDQKGIEAMVAPTFKDETLKKRDEFVKVLMLPRKTFSATVTSVNMQGADLALVNYSRSEVRGEEGKLLKEDIKGEIWGRDPANPNVWKLNKLAPGDKWFRTAEIPAETEEPGAEAKAAETAKEESPLGTIEEKKAAEAKAKEEEAKAKEEEAKAKAAETGEAEQKPDYKATMASVTAPGEKRYNPMGKKDPFLPWGAEGTGEITILCDKGRPREFLEKYELLSLKVQGIILTEGDPLALVTTPEGKGYTVRRRMYLGKNCGRVDDIDEEGLKITEKKKDPEDPVSDWQPVESKLKLRPEEGT